MNLATATSRMSGSDPHAVEFFFFFFTGTVSRCFGCLLPKLWRPLEQEHGSRRRLEVTRQFSSAICVEWSPIRQPRPPHKPDGDRVKRSCSDVSPFISPRLPTEPRPPPVHSLFPGLFYFQIDPRLCTTMRKMHRGQYHSAERPQRPPEVKVVIFFFLLLWRGAMLAALSVVLFSFIVVEAGKQAVPAAFIAALVSCQASSGKGEDEQWLRPQQSLPADCQIGSKMKWDGDKEIPLNGKASGVLRKKRDLTLWYSEKKIRMRKKPSSCNRL